MYRTQIIDGATSQHDGQVLSIRRARCRFLLAASALWAFIVTAGLFPAAAAVSQSVPSNYLSDNSDWWSYTRRADAEDEGLVQNREISVANFQILGLKLDDDIFGKATAKLGKGHIVKRGDGSAGRSQLC